MLEKLRKALASFLFSKIHLSVCTLSQLLSPTKALLNGMMAGVNIIQNSLIIIMDQAETEVVPSSSSV